MKKLRIKTPNLNKLMNKKMDIERWKNVYNAVTAFLKNGEGNIACRLEYRNDEAELGDFNPLSLPSLPYMVVLKYPANMDKPEESNLNTCRDALKRLGGEEDYWNEDGGEVWNHGFPVRMKETAYIFKS